ncbi:protein DMP9-like [Arachis stenosperma]|uniref:protein DMP9-like n=1 Tax=Arachis stenosperma TaxID=217475 RepID=UPI0025AD7701|nr:protein DMP9-like [Arachis stenosperma]
MEPTQQEVGIKVYNATPAPSHDDTRNSSGPVTLPVMPPETVRKNRRAIMAKGVQKTLNKTSLLGNFLPTGTLLTFEMVLPSIYKNGQCSHVHSMMTHVLLTICSLSCFFFHFTDSFPGPDGNIYYGFVTPKGLSVFKPGIPVQVPKDEKYKVSFTDFVHAFMSVLVFVAIAFSDHRVTNCLFPGHEKDMDQVMESFPLMVGVICSGLFLVFPNFRRGIGCMSA